MKRYSISLLLAICLSLSHHAPAAITVDGFSNDEVIRYPVPFLQGTLSDTSLTEIVATNLSSTRPSHELKGLADHGRFKVLAELCPGANHLQIKAGNETQDLQLIYKPQTNPHFIRAVLFTDETGDTRYDSPFPNDPQDFRGKYDTIMKIMQSFTADWMEHYGYGRRTFNLETDADGKVIVHIVKGQHAADFYKHGMDRNELYDRVTGETAAALSDAPSVDCTLISFSSLDPVTKKSLAYTALGGGKIALFGGACLYAFPNSLSEVQKTFTDGTIIDNNKYVSDSIERYTIWATASTSIGAMLHEMGHSMGLPHSNDPRDIMTRGIDNFGRYFVFEDPPSKRILNPVHFKPDETGYWSPMSAAALAPTLWLDLDARPKAAPAATTLALSPDSTQFTISNPHGLAFIGYERPGVAHSFKKIDLTAPLPKELTIPSQQVFDAVGKDASQFRIIDGDGVMKTFNLNEYGWAFLRQWHVSPTTMPWTDHSQFPDVSDQKLADIYRSAMAQRVRRSDGGQIDLPGVAPDIANYAAMLIKSDADQKVVLHTGSHDALRVWINGTLVTHSLTLRKVQPDMETSEATLKKGDNQVLVEVARSEGRGVFFLRLTNSDDNALKMNDDGSLSEIKPPELLRDLK